MNSFPPFHVGSYIFFLNLCKPSKQPLVVDRAKHVPALEFCHDQPWNVIPRSIKDFQYEIKTDM
jgi:hypothetical protein